MALKPYLSSVLHVVEKVVLGDREHFKNSLRLSCHFYETLQCFVDMSYRFAKMCTNLTYIQSDSMFNSHPNVILYV